jgi:polar amino acid transport system substrate-binding protein
MWSRRLFAAQAAAVAGGVTLLALQAQAQAPAPGSALERVRRTQTLRVAALPGEAPYFDKDVLTGKWSGMCVEMANDIASVLEAKVEYTESTYGNSVLDLQAGKIDLAFALNPTPKRALVIDFTPPFYLHGFGMVGKKGFTPSEWAELDKPDVRIAVEIGATSELATRRFAGHATITGYKTRDDCVLAVQSGRVDCWTTAANLGLTAIKKNPALGEFRVLRKPRVQLPVCIGTRMEADKHWRDFLSAWVDYNRGIQQIREWLYGGLAINGVKPEDIPADVEL